MPIHQGKPRAAPGEMLGVSPDLSAMQGDYQNPSQDAAAFSLG